jgi:hypothetical protein
VRARDRLCHPVYLVAIATLIVNDHWLKWHHPCWLTGKLSDVAGLTFFPLLVLAILPVRCTRVTIVVSAVATAVVFALIKTVPAATDVYRDVVGILNGLIGRGFGPVDAVTDPTDLVALPFVTIAVFTPSLRPHWPR